MSIFKKLSIVCTLFLSAIPHVVSAHVKWFAEPTDPIPPYKITDTGVVIWILISVAIILAGIYLERKLRVAGWLDKRLDALVPIVLSLASIGFGLALVIFSLQGFVLAPNLPAENPFGSLLLILQAVAGLMILLGFYERVGAILLLLAFSLGIAQYGALEMIDTLEVVGFALFVFIVGRPKWRLREAKRIQSFMSRFNSYGVPLLRIGTGLNLLVLGFSEKILAPSLTQNFLAEYHWNFMQALGFEHFTNYWFAFSAGVVESLFGIFLIFGLVTRLTTLVLAGFLITTLALLGPEELVGHLPHFSIAVVLLVLGSGSHLRLIKTLPKGSS